MENLSQSEFQELMNSLFEDFVMYDAHLMHLFDFSQLFDKLKQHDMKNHGWRWMLMYCCYLEKIKEEAKQMLKTKYNILFSENVEKANHFLEVVLNMPKP